MSKQICELMRAALAAWSADYAPSMGAALAFYLLFSIAPLLLLALAIAGVAFGEEAARGLLATELRGWMGAEAALAVQALLKSAARPEAGRLAAAVGSIAMLVGAMAVFGELQNAFDRIWRTVPAVGGSRLARLLRTRLLAFAMVLGVGVLLGASIAAGMLLAAAARWWSPRLGAWSGLLQGLDLALGFALATLAFAGVYKVLPRVRLAWRDVWTGAAVTGLLFVLGKLAIGIYLAHAGFASGFGAAGSLVVLLVWMAYSAQIFLLGAEFTRVHALTLGSLRRQAST